MERELIAGYAMAIQQQIEGRDTAVLDADLQRKRANSLISSAAGILTMTGFSLSVCCARIAASLDRSPCECRQTIAIPLLTATSDCAIGYG